MSQLVDLQGHKRRLRINCLIRGVIRLLVSRVGVFFMGSCVLMRLRSRYLRDIQAASPIIGNAGGWRAAFWVNLFHHEFNLARSTLAFLESFECQIVEIPLSPSGPLHVWVLLMSDFHWIGSCRHWGRNGWSWVAIAIGASVVPRFVGMEVEDPEAGVLELAIARSRSRRAAERRTRGDVKSAILESRLVILKADSQTSEKNSGKLTIRRKKEMQWMYATH